MPAHMVWSFIKQKDKFTFLPDISFIHFIYYKYDRAIAHAVSRRLPIAAARVRSQVNLSGICGGQSGNGASFLRVHRFPLPILIPPTAPHLSSGAGAIGQIVTDVASGLSLAPPQESKAEKYTSIVVGWGFRIR
jgi:hypothetical protein